MIWQIKIPIDSGSLSFLVSGNWTAKIPAIIEIIPNTNSCNGGQSVFRFCIKMATMPPMDKKEKFLIKSRAIYAQYAENILNKIANPFNKTYTGRKSITQGFQIYFAWNPRLKDIESIS